MKRVEFNKWLERHGEAFPGILDWIETKGGKRIADRWFDVLKLTDYESACDATDKMLGNPESASSNYTSHPAKIKQICSGQSLYRSREFANECMCGGTGMVEVLNDRVFKTPEHHTLTTETVTVLCKCPEGQWKYDHQGGPRPGGGEYPRMLMFDGSMKVFGVKYDEPPPMSSGPVANPFDDLPAYQPGLYAPKGIDK